MMNIRNLFASVGLTSLVALTLLISTSTVKASSPITQVAKSNWVMGKWK